MKNRNLSPVGKNKSMKSIIDEYVDQYKNDTDRIHKQYEDYMEMMKNDPTPEIIHQFFKNQPIQMHRLDDHFNLVLMTEDEDIAYNNEQIRKGESRRKYNYVKRIVNKDNQPGVYNSGNGCGYRSSIRVPSLKRSNKVWKNFYSLFPFLEGLDKYCGAKLKKIKK